MDTAPGLFLLAGFVVAGIGWVYLAMYVNYGDRKEALEIADSLDDEPGPR